MWGEGGPGTSGGSVSRSCPLHRPESAAMAADALKLVRLMRVVSTTTRPCHSEP